MIGKRADTIQDMSGLGKEYATNVSRWIGPLASEMRAGGYSIISTEYIYIPGDSAIAMCIIDMEPPITATISDINGSNPGVSLGSRPANGISEQILDKFISAGAGSCSVITLTRKGDDVITTLQLINGNTITL